MSQLTGTLASPDFYQSPQEEIQQLTRELADIEARLAAAFDRWSELER